MGPLSSVPGHVEATPESVATFRHALAALPADAVPAILARLEAAIRHAESTGDLTPAQHVLDSVLMTARLQENVAYRSAVAEADAEEARGEDDPVDVADFVAEMRAKYGS